MTLARSSSGLVYATDTGRMCPQCRKPLAQCACKTNAAIKAKASGDGVVRVSRESKGRGGKTVTVVKGLDMGDVPLAQLAKQLKAACGSGGTVKDGVIEVQGDHRALVMQVLSQQGWTVKQAGG